MDGMATNPNRVPAGVPTGGRFAPLAHPRPTISLDAEPAAPAEDPMVFSAEEAAEWKRLGFSRPQAQVWRTLTAPAGMISAGEAGSWSRSFRVLEAVRWRSAGFAEAEASRWAGAGFTPEPRGPASAAAWSKALGPNPKQAREWAKLGFEPSEAARWRDAGFGTGTAMHWANDAYGPAAAARAVAEGKMTPAEDNPDDGWG
jgi:hypothetical protein